MYGKLHSLDVKIQNHTIQGDKIKIYKIGTNIQYSILVAEQKEVKNFRDI